jgi:uncharacterized protein YcnI
MSPTRPRPNRLRRRVLRTVAALPVMVLATLALTTGPASAHVEIDPAQAPPSTFGTFTLSVPNEKADQDTIEIDVRIPVGFEVEDAQQLPGWRTVVDQASDGTVTGIRWQGGSIAPHTFATFSLRGRTPSRPGSISFLVDQRYERSVVSWNGASESSPTPAPILAVSGVAGGGATKPAATGGDDSQVPAAATPTTAPAASTGHDDLARSRADLALALAGALLVGALAAGTLLVLRRRAGAGPG